MIIIRPLLDGLIVVSVVGERERQQMGLGSHDELIQVDGDIRIIGKQHVQVLEGLGENKGIHPVFVDSSSDIIHGCVTARYPRVLLKRFQGGLSNIEVMVVPRGSV